MPDNNTPVPVENKANKIQQPKDPKRITVKRNDVELTFVEARTTKGKSPGSTIFPPEVEQKDSENFFKWIGLENLFGMTKSKVRALTSGWVEDATDDDTGIFSEVKFAQFAADFSAGGEAIGELRDKLDELQDSLATLDLSKTENHPKMLELGMQMQKLKIAIDQKSRKKSDSKEDNTPAATDKTKAVVATA